MTPPITAREIVPDASVDRLINDMSGHGGRTIRQPFERTEIMPLQFLQRRIDDRQGKMTVGKGPAMAGHMLHYGQHGTGEQAFHRRTAKCRDDIRLLGISPVADDIARTRNRHIKHRHAVNRDADGAQILRHKPRAEPHHLATAERIVDRRNVRAEGYFGQCGGPMRCTRPPS